MGEIKKGQESKQSKEIVLDRAITEKDIAKINEMAPITITISNTKNLNSNVIAKLNKNIKIRVLGGFNELKFPEYANEKYYNQTVYSPEEIARLIDYLTNIEAQINPNWSDLEKATFGYITLMSRIRPKTPNEKLDPKGQPIENDYRPFKQMIDGKADSLGYSFAFKELMERQGIACRYMQNNKSNSWNEVLIDGEYYPLDLYLDAVYNEKTILNGEFELNNFLSDREFYYKPEHKTIEKYSKEFHSLEHSEIQKTINKVMNPEKEERTETTKISLKSKELQKTLQIFDITSVEDFGKNEEIRIDFTNSDVTDIKEDLTQISKYYPRALDNIILSNNTGTHIDMQEVINTIYEGRKNEEGRISEPTNLVIESNIAEDFNLDFSNAPEVEIDDDRKMEDVNYNQKISFVNTSQESIKLPDLSGKIPDSIDTICIQDCDAAGFNIKTNNVIGPNTGVLKNVRKLELVGGNTHGIKDIIGLDDVISLSVNNLSAPDFDDVMNIAIPNASIMPRLFELNIDNQQLKNRPFLSEIKNPNIINLEILRSELNNITGLDSLKNQLIQLSLQGNNLTIDDMKQISDIANENPIFRKSFFGNKSLSNEIDNLSGNIISDDTYNYLDSYFRRSGYIDYRNMKYRNYTDIKEKKKQMLKDFSLWDLDKVPYFIEDAKVFRDILPYTNNPIMIKDLTTFQNYLNNNSNYFEQDYLKNGTLWLTKEQLNYLISTGKTIPQNINVKINTVSEMTKEELENLKIACDNNGLKLNGVNVFDDRCIDSTNPTIHNFDEKDTQLDTYNIDEYYKIRDSLDEIIEGIFPSMSDAEKFAVIYKRIADKVATYDHSVTGDPLSKEHAIYQARMRNKSRNLSEGLIEQEGFDIQNNIPDPTLTYRAVCAGYADILKNALDLVGIESVMDSGNAKMNLSKNKPMGGHQWNKIKIDGKWYYADCCWDAGKANYNWALKGVDSFVRSNNIIKNKDGEQIEVNCHITRVKQGERNEHMERNDYDRAVLNDLFYKVKNNELPPKYRINIPDDPDFTFNPTLDLENIKQEYIDRKNDMLAKFYGDRDYQRRYDEVAARHRENEVEVTTNGITYRTIQDYAEREEDEKFLILGEYKNSLERMTKYDAGDRSVYSGSDAQIRMQYEKDKEYVETRNYTFDQHKNTQKNLATLGKYGETMPYIPRQQGILRNGLRVVGNAGIFARNIVAPAYRFVGRYVAQPLHRAITRGRDASPYRNNPYHRFVARRDYYRDVARENDRVNGKNHSIRNYIMSNVNAMARYKEGNTAVLKAGAYDIQDNLKNQEIQRLGVDFYKSKKLELETQIRDLEDEINKHPEAQNNSVAQTRLNAKKALLTQVEQNLVTVNTTGKITDIQTDAISQTQHDIASKEVNTYRVAAIKGVAKLGIKKFVGPKLKEWLLEHTEKRVKKDVVYQSEILVEKEIQDPPQTISITESRPDYDIEVDELIERSKDKTVSMYRSVSGGNRGEINYTIRGDEICSGFHFQDGSKWGTGFSSNVPLMTDKAWPATFLDANNNLRADLTFSEIAKAISDGELSEELLGNMTFQIGNKGWVYANELFDGVTKEVEIGKKIIEGATRKELVPQMVNRTKTIYEMVENERVLNALNTLGVATNIASKADTVHNVAEIVRPTNSEVKTNKKRQREYDYDDSEFYV